MSAIGTLEQTGGRGGEAAMLGGSRPDRPGRERMPGPPTPPAAPSRASHVAASIEAGHVFIYAEAGEAAARQALLAEALDAVAGPSRKVIRVGNQLRAPLTIERIMIQAAGPDADSAVEHNPALLASLLTKQAEADGRVLVVIEQPETIDPEAVALLAAMRPHLAGGCVQLLLAGPPSAAKALIEAEAPAVPPPVSQAELAAVARLLIRSEMPAASPPVSQSEPVAAAPRWTKRIPLLPPAVVAPPRRRRALRAAVAILVLFGAAGALVGRDRLTPALAGWRGIISQHAGLPAGLTGQPGNPR